MGREIERKFLVVGGGWKRKVEETYAIRQGYLATSKDTVVRVRISSTDRYQIATLAVKGSHSGIERAEFEYRIPVDEAQEMLEILCGDRIVEKRRHIVPSTSRLRWEIDVFGGRHKGLVLAEIELVKVDQEMPRIPKWIGHEVSEDHRYSNHSLAKHGLKLMGD